MGRRKGKIPIVHILRSIDETQDVVYIEEPAPQYIVLYLFIHFFTLCNFQSPFFKKIRTDMSSFLLNMTISGSGIKNKKPLFGPQKKLISTKTLKTGKKNSMMTNGILSNTSWHSLLQATAS